MESRGLNPPNNGGFVFDHSSTSSNPTTPPRTESPGLGHEDSIVSTPIHKPFATMNSSRFGSRNSSAVHLAKEREAQRYFRSRRINKEDVQQPWKANKDPREKWVTIIPIIGLVLGFCMAGFLVFDGLKSIVNHQYTLVLDESFSKGLDPAIWTQESTVGGFGNGEFEQTTSGTENVFINGGKLHIKPTFQDPKLLTTDNNLTLTDCTGTTWSDCNAVTNSTNGTIIPPMKSGRINTKKGATIKYGRVEVTATLPEGDWLWPAIWMMPVNNTYGPWPASGEIDIMETRGNNYTYAQGGNNIISSALHWGPTQGSDAWWRTNVKRTALHTTFAKTEHMFGVEWSEKYLFTYIDNRLLQVLYSPFTQDLWSRGQFQIQAGANGTSVTNPWQAGNVNAPFDQKFYLILNVAIGGTNGWFEDGKSGKPWVDKSTTAAKDFISAKDQWFPTWKNPEMVVSKVQMWQQQDVAKKCGAVYC